MVFYHSIRKVTNSQQRISSWSVEAINGISSESKPQGLQTPEKYMFAKAQEKWSTTQLESTPCLRLNSVGQLEHSQVAWAKEAETQFKDTDEKAISLA